MTSQDRIVGCLLGGAAGDALGAAVEFECLPAIRRIYGPDGISRPARVYGRIGAITDDTQMLLFTAEGLLCARATSDAPALEDDVAAVHRAYLRWLDTQDGRRTEDWKEGWLLGVDALHARRAPGNTCLSALRTGEIGTPSYRLNDSKGCGGVLRVAPAGLVGPDDPFALGQAVAAITHSHPSGHLSAGALALMLHEILAGRTIDEALPIALQRLETEPDSDETSKALREAKQLAAEAEPAAENVARLGEGWVAEEALAISVYCALAHPTDFAAAVRLAVNHSGDSDSTGAITGNLMGAALGPDAIPPEWLEVLELREEIEQIALDLAHWQRPQAGHRARYGTAPGRSQGG